MYYKTKPFDSSSHALHDLTGKATLVNLLMHLGCKKIVANDPESCTQGKCPNWDVKAESPSGHIGLFDVEVRTNWKQGQQKFPYPTIHVPARKRRGSYNNVNYFAAISSDHKGIAIIPRSLFDKSQIIRSHVSNWDELDHFADVKITNEIWFYKLE